MPIGSAWIPPRRAVLGLMLAMVLIVGLLLMHVLTMAPSETPHPGGRVAMAEEGGSTASVAAADDAEGGGVHAGGVCLSSTAKSVDVLPAQTEPVWAAPLPDPPGVALREASISIDRSNLLSLCVLRR